MRGRGRGRGKRFVQYVRRYGTFKGGYIEGGDDFLFGCFVRVVVGL